MRQQLSAGNRHRAPSAPGRSPIIILQGDHGTAFLDYSGATTASRVNLEAAGERFSAFGAYFLPDSGATVFGNTGDTVAVVNVLGRVLRTYAGADLPTVPDEQYLSIDRAPFDMYRVEVSVARPPALPHRAWVRMVPG